MEQELLQIILVFIAGLLGGALLLLLWNKLSSGSASPSTLKQEHEDYQKKVEEHFEATSKKFQDMTEQYQDLYKHLSVGATSLCRPDSVAAGLVDHSDAGLKLEQRAEPQAKEDEAADTVQEEVAKVEEVESPVEPTAVSDAAAQAEQEAQQARVEEVLGEQTAEALKEAASENSKISKA